MAEIVALMGLVVYGLMFFWVGYRLGFSNGLATWRKSYLSMTPSDIKKHKSIIRSMPDKA